MRRGRTIPPLHGLPPLQKKQLRPGIHRSTRDIRRYIEISNHNSKPFVWTKTADEILASVARFWRVIPDSAH